MTKTSGSRLSAMAEMFERTTRTVTAAHDMLIDEPHGIKTESGVWN